VLAAQSSRPAAARVAPNSPPDLLLPAAQFVLPAAHRMRRSSDFAEVIRRGSRVRRGVVVVHRLSGTSDRPALVGLVVGKSVGGSVVRHQVSRRLRGVLAGHLDELAPGSSTVIRALPGTAGSSSAELDRDIDAALRALAVRP
jgi:ribonuclease P protein component